jgi:hypothetical protein
MIPSNSTSKPTGGGTGTTNTGTGATPNTGTSGTTTTTTPIQVPANKDGSCPAGSHEVGGSSGSAGQPGTGSVICISDNPPPASGGGTTNTSTSNTAQHPCGEGNYNKATAHYELIWKVI